MVAWGDYGKQFCFVNNILYLILPNETFIKEQQQGYYDILAKCDQSGDSTLFVEFMLSIIDRALKELLSSQPIHLKSTDRIELFHSIIGGKHFSRKDYRRHFKDIFTATTSRDLREAIQNNFLEKSEENEEKQNAQDAKNEESSVFVSNVITTEEELQGFYIVKSILHGMVDLDRIAQRDTISYFGILLDDNNRKPICRLHFNGGKKYVETFDADKKGTKHPVESAEGIYDISNEIIKSLSNYIEEN